MSTVPQSLKNRVYYLARDGMSVAVCALLIDKTEEQIKELIEQEVLDISGQHVTPLIIAARNGHDKVVKIILSKFKPNIEKEGSVRVDGYVIEGATALWCAAGGGHLNVVKTLVKAGADVNHTTLTNSTPLRAACFDGRLDVVKYLIEHGANIHIANKYNNTCLMISAYKGHLDVVSYLLSKGVKTDEQALCGATSLLFAAESGHTAVVTELLKYGAKLIPNQFAVSNCGQIKPWPTLVCERWLLVTTPFESSRDPPGDQDSHVEENRSIYLTQRSQQCLHSPDLLSKPTPLHSTFYIRHSLTR